MTDARQHPQEPVDRRRAGRCRRTTWGWPTCGCPGRDARGGPGDPRPAGPAEHDVGGDDGVLGPGDGRAAGRPRRAGRGGHRRGQRVLLRRRRVLDRRRAGRHRGRAAQPDAAVLPDLAGGPGPRGADHRGGQRGGDRRRAGLALACDLRYAAEDAKLGVPFTALGMHPGMATTYLLPEVAGLAVAREMLLTGRHRHRRRGGGVRAGDPGGAARRGARRPRWRRPTRWRRPRRSRPG